VKKNLNFVIVGHVDHGKSTLIGRLFYDTNSLPNDFIEEIKKTCKMLGKNLEFAYILDSLEEERKQNITIDTTQAFFKTKKREYVFIDAPGHREFIKNMITGASQAQAAVLLVDATVGIEEQTRRHAYILNLLGIYQVIVAINKMDLVNYSEDQYNKVKTQTQKFLRSLNIQAFSYIPVSAMKGDNIANKSENMSWFNNSTFLEVLDTLKKPETAVHKSLIFSVQDVYKIDEKRIVVGKIETGNITKGMRVKILPGGEITRIKSIEKFLEDRDQACAGESIGITTEDSVFCDRGNIICSHDTELNMRDEFVANIFWMSREKLRKTEKLLLRCGTQETLCKIIEIKKRFDSSDLKVIERNGHTLENLEVGEIVVKTKEPIVITSFSSVPGIGRFVLTQKNNVVAGGIIPFVK